MLKKTIRHFLSGYFVILLFLLLQVSFALFLQFFLDDFLISIGAKNANTTLIALITIVLVHVISGIMAFILFFVVIGKNDAPDFKIPWVAGLILFPILVTIVYVTFVHHELRKKDRKNLAANRKSYSDFVKDSNYAEPDLFDELDNAKGIFKYVNNVTSLNVYKNTKVTYYSCGEKFFPQMMEALRSAKKFIFIEFFIIADGHLWSEVQDILYKKKEEGVEIRMIYDDLGSSGTVSDFTARNLRKKGIKCYKFNPFRPLLSGVYNNRDHRKIVVIDNEIGFTGGMNLGDEYGNYEIRFGYWKDTMIKIEGAAITNLIKIFLQNYGLASGEIIDFSKYLSHEYKIYDEEGYVMPFGDGPGGVDDALIGEQTYINMINNAKKEVYISTPYFIPTYSLLDSIKNAALRGIKIHLIVPGIPDKKMVYMMAKSYFSFLLASGVQIYFYTPGFNHMKTVLVDDEVAFVGTINFDYRSLVHHYECGSLLYKNPCLKDIKADFEDMISKSQIVPSTFKIRGIKRPICSFLRLFSPLL